MSGRIVRTTPGSLADAVDDVATDEVFGALVVAVGDPDLDRFDRVAWSRRSVLVRCCVGVVVVADEPSTRDRIASFAGRVPFPVTAVADERDALGWLAGQLAAGIRGIRPAGGGRTVAVTPEIDDYVISHLNPPSDPLVAELSARTTARFGVGAAMNIGEDQGRLLRLLVEITGARHVVEVGTFTGMSALWLARGLPPDGRLTCFEIDPECIELARVTWAEAGVADRISVVIGPAVEGLSSLPDGEVDLAFIDADKPGYATYVEALLARLAPGGLILLDNTLWGGAVVHPAANDESTLALRALNDDLASRSGLDVLTLPIGDGLTFVRRAATT